MEELGTMKSCIKVCTTNPKYNPQLTLSNTANSLMLFSDGFNRSMPESSATPNSDYVSSLKSSPLNHSLSQQQPRMPTYFDQHPMQINPLTQSPQVQAYAQSRLATSWLHHQLQLASQARGSQALLKPNPITPWQNVMLSCRPPDAKSYFPYTTFADRGFEKFQNHLPHQDSATNSTETRNVVSGSEDSLDKTSEAGDDEDDIKIVPQPESANTKKRNPYSIEELLKKPTKLAKTLPSIDGVKTNLRQPCGILLTENVSSYSNEDNMKNDDNYNGSDRSISPRSCQGSPDSYYGDRSPGERTSRDGSVDMNERCTSLEAIQT